MLFIAPRFSVLVFKNRQHPCISQLHVALCSEVQLGVRGRSSASSQALLPRAHGTSPRLWACSLVCEGSDDSLFPGAVEAVGVSLVAGRLAVMKTNSKHVGTQEGAPSRCPYSHLSVRAPGVNAECSVEVTVTGKGGGQDGGGETSLGAPAV